VNHVQAVLERVPKEETMIGLPPGHQWGALHLLAGMPWALGNGTWEPKSAADAAATAAYKLAARPSLLRLATPDHLANTLWGLGRFRSSTDATVELFGAFSRSKAHDATPGAWANVVYAMGRCRLANHVILEQAMRRICPKGLRDSMHELNVAQVARLAFGASSLKIKDECATVVPSTGLTAAVYCMGARGVGR
jgi:hypothetical protein